MIYSHAMVLMGKEKIEEAFHVMASDGKGKLFRALI